MYLVDQGHFAFGAETKFILGIDQDQAALAGNLLAALKDGNGGSAKFWLRPPRLRSSRGLTRRELSRIEGIVLARHEQFVRAWNDYFES